MELSNHLCECGCGKFTKIAARTRTIFGHIKGQPLRCLRGHSLKVSFTERAARFWKHVEKEGPVLSHCAELGACWIWGGFREPITEYGKVGINGIVVSAHRGAWYFTYGDWPKGDTCHKCDNRSCVNPSHLFDGTRKENNEDKARKGRGTARLTEQQVLEIRKKYKAGITQRVLAEEYGIAQSNIGEITLGRNYKYIPMETP